MRVIQLMTTIAYGDAVSNDALAIGALLKKNGYETFISAQNIGDGVPRNMVRQYQFNKMKRFLKDADILLYHGSTGTSINNDIPHLPGRKIMRYHNITPSHFFHQYSEATEKLTGEGILQVQNLKDSFVHVIGDSSFNLENLREMGYRCPMDVCPILIPFNDYKQAPDEDTLRRYQDGITNILFVGRIAPNKKQEDLIASFYLYQKHYDPNSRLILAGSWGGMERYYRRLTDYVRELGIEDKVVFSGHIRFSEILALYRSADLFLCLSEHEGFCVPLVEAMCFRIPIIAYDSCAVGETLSEGGILLPFKDPAETAAAMHYLLHRQELCNVIKMNQKERLHDFASDIVGAKIISILKEYM